MVTSLLMQILSAHMNYQVLSQWFLLKIFYFFVNNYFLHFNASGFPSYFLINSYDEEEIPIKRTITISKASDVSDEANEIYSHYLYEIKMSDRQSLKLKERIESNGALEWVKQDLETDCEIFSRTGLKINVAIASLIKMQILKADVKSAILKTREAKSDVYVILPRWSDGWSRDSSSCQWQHVDLLMTMRNNKRSLINCFGNLDFPKFSTSSRLEI